MKKAAKQPSKQLASGTAHVQGAWRAAGVIEHVGWTNGSLHNQIHAQPWHVRSMLDVYVAALAAAAALCSMLCTMYILQSVWQTVSGWQQKASRAHLCHQKDVQIPAGDAVHPSTADAPPEDARKSDKAGCGKLRRSSPLNEQAYTEQYVAAQF